MCHLKGTEHALQISQTDTTNGRLGVPSREPSRVGRCGRGQLIPARSRLGLRLPGFAGPCVRLALALHTWWLIVLAALCLGEQSILLYSAGEPLQGGLERLALFDDHFAHAMVVAVGLTARRALLSLLLSATLPVCIRSMPFGAKSARRRTPSHIGHT
jgi:hypothetical protein